jgi:hypothetical protein
MRGVICLVAPEKVGVWFLVWFLASPSEPGPSNGQLKGLAVLGVIAGIALGLLKGVSYLELAVVFILILHTPLSYGCLLPGGHVAEIAMDVRPWQSRR